MVWHYQVPANTFVDPDGDALSVSAQIKNGASWQPLPNWLTFDPSSGPFGQFTGMPESAGLFAGDFQIRLTATDGVDQVHTDFVLHLGEASGLPIFVALPPTPEDRPKCSIYDCIVTGPGTAKVIFGLDKVPRGSMCWKYTTQNSDGTISSSHYVAKSGYVHFQPGEQFTSVDVQILANLSVSQRVAIVLTGSGQSRSGTAIRGSAFIMTQAAADAFAAAGTPTVLAPNGYSLTKIPLPVVPKGKPGYAVVFHPDLVGDFEATDTGYKADGVTKCWVSKPGLGGSPTSGREQTGNKEDGYYTDPEVYAGTNPFPLVTYNGQQYRSMRAEYLDGLDGRPSSIPSNSLARTYQYTAAMITSEILFPEIDIGDYVEVRSKQFPTAHTWPAIWLMPTVGWPPEIDLMEGFYTSVHPDRIGTTIHFGDDNRAYGSFYGWSEILGYPFVQDGFNIWGCWMTAEWLVFYLNDVPYAMYPNMCLAVDGPKKWYLLLNTAVGGNGSGTPNNPEQFPVDFLIDDVKVWRKAA